MAAETKTTKAQIHTVSIAAQDHKFLSSAAKLGRFTLHFLEMTVVMMVGMPFFFMLRNRIPASSPYAAVFVRGTIPYDLAMVAVMVIPMAAWMIVRGHGWRHSAEMAFAMSAPMVAVIALRLLGADASWLRQVGYSGMFLGMLFAMLYRRDHYTGSHASHTAHPKIASMPDAQMRHAGEHAHMAHGHHSAGGEQHMAHAEHAEHAGHAAHVDHGGHE